MTAAGCSFCRKLAALYSNSGNDVVWQFPQSVAFLGRWQCYNGYCVLVSRRHATELSELGYLERRSYLDEMCLLAEAILSGFRPHKLNHELLGNKEPHLHWHLFPRYLDDPSRFKPVCLALEQADRDTEMRQTMETGLRGRAAVMTILRDQLKRLNALTA